VARIDEQPDLKESLQGLEKATAKQRQLLERIAAYAARRECHLLAAIEDPRRLEHSGRKVYSQNDEDGIIEEIFRRVRMKPARGIFIEFGAGHGNVYWVWKSIRSFSAAVVVVEYNARCAPPVAQVQEYEPDRVGDGTDYFGASVSALEKLGAEKGYRLVGCNITGTNAFFVRQDLVGDHFPYQSTAEHLYQPPRYDLTYDCFARVGHKPSPGVYVDV
jgi:hypothetical protein